MSTDLDKFYELCHLGAKLEIKGDGQFTGDTYELNLTLDNKTYRFITDGKYWFEELPEPIDVNKLIADNPELVKQITKDWK